MGKNSNINVIITAAFLHSSFTGGSFLLSGKTSAPEGLRAVKKTTTADRLVLFYRMNSCPVNRAD